MSIIPGVTVLWYLSPRIIVIPSPLIEATVEDMQDTLLDIEDSENGISFPKLRDTSGGQELGGGVTVGWTIQLYNSQIMFEGRTTPIGNGTATSDNSDGTILTDSTAQFITDAIIYVGCTLFNVDTNEMGVITEIISETQVRTLPLSGFGGYGWTTGDTYSIYPNVQCSLSGGNWTAVDESGNSISPIIQSPNVQIVMASSSSATSANQAALEYSTFEGGITFDPINGYSIGYNDLVGNRQYPVKTLAEVLEISAIRGFNTIYVVGDTEINDSGDYSEMIFVGESTTKSTFTVSPGANVLNCEFSDATLAGTLDGNAKVNGCRILDLNYINGIIEGCLLGPGTITLGGGLDAFFMDCWSGVATGDSYPTINCGGSGQSLIMNNYNGDIKITNKTGTDFVTINLNVGYVVLDETVTGDNIIIRGVGDYVNNGTATVDDSNLLNSSKIADMGLDTLITAPRVAGGFGQKIIDALKLKRTIK